MEDWVNGVDLWTRDFTKPGPRPLSFFGDNES